jgi:WD40 repeat protein
MAPEQFIPSDSDYNSDNADGDDDAVNGRKPSYTHAVDIWALGVIAFQLLTTQLPFPAGDWPKSMALRKYVSGKSPFPRDVLGAMKITSAGCAWIEDCMARAPHHRPTAGFSLRNKWPMGSTSDSEVQQLSKKPSKSTSSASGRWDARDSGSATAARHPSLKEPESSTPRVQASAQAPRPVPTTKDLSVFGIDNTECSWVEGQEIPADRVRAAEFSPDGQQLAVLPGNRAVCIWSATKGLEGTQLPGLSEYSSSIKISPDGRQIASVSADGAAASIWDLATWKQSRQFKGHKVDVKCIAFSLDGRLLATAGTRRSRIDLDDLIPNWTKIKVSIWNATTGAQMKYFEPHGRWLTEMVFSPDGSKLAFIGGGTSPQLWDPATGTELATLERRSESGEPSLSLYCMAFSPDGRQLAGGCSYGTLKIWDTATGVQIKLKKIETAAPWLVSISFVSYSPDGRKLAFRRREDHHSGTVGLWDTVTGEETEQVIFSQNEKTERFRLFISPDGRRVAVCGTGKVSIWSR